MFLDERSIQDALNKLDSVHPFFGISFLAFKRNKLPIGDAKEIVFSQIADNILDTYYRPSSTYNGYYHPFQTSDKSNRWVKPRYGSTSLQRITTDTFGDCLIHEKKSSSWGWRYGYAKVLQKHLKKKRIPAYYLAAWLYRKQDWSAKITAKAICEYFFKEFHITPEEQELLFDTSANPPTPSLSDFPLTEPDLLDIIGLPPGAEPGEGASLRYLETRHIGPSDRLRYEPSERLNVITGDNSLGKTFILECIWWSLTGSWLDQEMVPTNKDTRAEPSISFGLATKTRKPQTFVSNFNRERQRWATPTARKALSGLVLYARHDGSFAVWDPARARIERDRFKTSNHVFFTKKEVWEGLKAGADARREWICNGLIRDWVSWQTAGIRYSRQFESFAACLRGLSPSADEQLAPGEPMRLGLDSREVPTLKMPYGNVPVLHASAGVQRIIALSYLLVWAWHEHLSLSEIVGKEPERRIVLIMDEVEAHLHPKWQRVIVPALMRVISDLAVTVSPQVHLATHSPMILASIETIFSERCDSLHHLKLEKKKVVLEELPFRKRGRTDLWLISDVFGLEQARSLPAEKAISEAKKIQLSKKPSSSDVQSIHQQLVQCLAEDDEFWPRWTFFATEHGVKI